MTNPVSGGVPRESFWPFAWCFCNTTKEHIAEFASDMHVVRFRPSTEFERREYRAAEIHRWQWMNEW